MKNEKVSIVERLREREKTLIDTKTALSNLQIVLRDIGIDHEAQVAQYENEIAELKRSTEVNSNFQFLDRNLFQLTFSNLLCDFFDF